MTADLSAEKREGCQAVVKDAMGGLRTKHHPVLNATGRHGCWATCCCGWTSPLYTTVTGAHLAFGQHLTEAR